MGNKPSLYDLKTVLEAGINPKNGLPIKFGPSPCNLKDNIKKVLRIIDEQDAVNSFTWYNLPKGINGQMLERMLYYRKKLILFRYGGEFYLLPYTLVGNIDVYGRFIKVTPLPFNGTAEDGKHKDKPWLVGLEYTVQYDVVTDLTKEIFDKGCVILNDYTDQVSQSGISRQILNEPILDLESECLPYMRTNLINSTGIQGVRVADQDQAQQIELASDSIDHAALTGKKWIPLQSGLEMQELTPGNVAKSEEFLMSMQSIDNIRLKTHGLDSGGIFEKKAHMLQDELGKLDNSSALQDRWQNRLLFCDIANSIWGLNIYCEPNQNAVGDYDMDGIPLSDNSYTGNQMEESEE